MYIFVIYTNIQIKLKIIYSPYPDDVGILLHVSRY